MAACYFLQHKTDAFQGARQASRKAKPKPRRVLYRIWPSAWRNAGSISMPKSISSGRWTCSPSCRGRRTNSACFTCAWARKRWPARPWKKPSSWTASTSRSATPSKCSTISTNIKRSTTKHFRLRYDPKNDKVLARFMAKYLGGHLRRVGRTNSIIVRREPILIEVFNKHEMFSGRVVALPDLHTIGACTGRMIAMVSPHDKSKVIGKPFNWVRVIRHELVHVFNLEQTKFQVPHWFTEGLAVTNEGMGDPPRWRVAAGGKVGGQRLAQSRQHPAGVCPAAHARPMAASVSAKPALRGILDQNARRRGHRQAAHRLWRGAGHRSGLGKDLQRHQGGLREGLSGVSRRACREGPKQAARKAD